MSKTVRIVFVILLFAALGFLSLRLKAVKNEKIVLQDSISLVKSDYTFLEDRLHNVRNNPYYKLSYAIQFYEMGSYEASLSYFKELTADTLDDLVTKTAKDYIGKIEKTEENKEKERQRVRELTFKTLRIEPYSDLTNMIIKSSGFKRSNYWDVYTVVLSGGIRYTEKLNASFGSDYITFDMSITSGEDNPALPVAYLCVKLDGDYLKNLGEFEYSFKNWGSMEMLHGLKEDENNDFRYSNTIDFTLGFEVSESLANKPLFVLLDTSPCMTRIISDVEPSIRYVNSSCVYWDDLHPIVVDKSFKVLKVLNGDKL